MPATLKTITPSQAENHIRRWDIDTRLNQLWAYVRKNKDSLESERHINFIRELVETPLPSALRIIAAKEAEIERLSVAAN